MQKSVVRAIKSLCEGNQVKGGTSAPAPNLPPSLVEEVLFFAEHIPDSFPPPTPTLYPPGKLVLEWWLGSSSRVKIVFQKSRPVTYEISTPDQCKTGKMIPPAEFASILNSLLSEPRSNR